VRWLLQMDPPLPSLVEIIIATKHPAWHDLHMKGNTALACGQVRSDWKSLIENRQPQLPSNLKLWLHTHEKITNLIIYPHACLI